MAKPKKDRLRIIPLGGLDEVGKNMTVFEYGDDMVLVDAGLMFPDADLPGVDLVLPDYTYVLKRRDKLRGIVITHGHEDHVGALPYLLRDLGTAVPVLGTRLTLGLLAGKLEEFRLTKPKLREVRDGTHMNLGVFGFDFIPVNHSIPDGVALLIRTPVGNVLHTGDFKFDQTPIDGRRTDFAALSKAGRDGVILLMSDSTGAERKGYSRPEAEIGVTLRRIVHDARKRVIVASFASHIHRVQQVCDAAREAGRTVVVTGRSMITNTGIARSLGYLDVEDRDIVDAYDAAKLPADKVLILCTGSQGEPLSALARMANADHRTVSIESGDTVIVSASPVPGNEKSVGRVLNKLFKAGAEVFYRDVADVHVTGHASAEELKLMLTMVRPRYFMPIHGETRHLVSHARLANSVGMKDADIFVMENGRVLEIDAGGARVTGPVEAGAVYVDGLTVGDVGDVVLRDRQRLSSEGVATIVVAIDSQSGQLLGDFELVVRGLPLSGDDDPVIADARTRIAAALERTQREHATDHSVVSRAVRDAVSASLWENLHRRPMIVPIVMEV